MKRHFILFFIVALYGLTNLKAQFETSGTEDFGRLFDITYDLNVEDKLYASTLKNHLLVSYDKGENWEILFSFPITEAIEIHDLKQMGDNTLSFIMYNLDSNNNKLVFYDMETNELTKEIYPPYEADFNRIKSYSVYAPIPISFFYMLVLTGKTQRKYFTQPMAEKTGRKFMIMHKIMALRLTMLSSVRLIPINFF